MCSRCPPSRTMHVSILFLKFSITLWHVALVIALITLVISSFKAAMVCGRLTYTLSFKKPHKKKSGGLRSGLCGDQMLAVLFDMTLSQKNGWNGPYFQRWEKHGRNHYIKKRLNTHNLHIPGYNIWKGDKNWMNSFCVNGTNVVDRSGRTPCKSCKQFSIY